MILTKETLSAGPKIGTGEGVAHSKRWYVALVRMHHEKKVASRKTCLYGKTCFISVSFKIKVLIHGNKPPPAG